jgi:hypothetical protein
LTIGNFNSASANSCLADYNWAQNALVLLTDAAAQSGEHDRSTAPRDFGIQSKPGG